ncbi:MAG: hypothetical protein IIX97_06605 [Clostridia bacterium]|nr:hypothetical protein [Clostridia bacterium]
MYSGEYYDKKRAEFDSVFNEFTSRETSIKTMVRKELEEQEAREARSYEENEYLEEFTAIADNMKIATVDDFEKYLTACLGGRLKDGVRMLKEDNSAFFSSSDAVVLAEEPRSLCDMCDGEGSTLWKEKTIKVNTWNRVDGFTETETLVRTPITEKQLVRMLKWEKAFPRYKRVKVKDKKLPIYSIISVLICMAVLMLPVFLSVICNEVEVQNKEYDAYIRQLGEEIEELEAEVSLKKDMQLIDELARNEYGMIDAELSQIERVESEEDTFILENAEEKEEQSVWVTLLSAIGIID